MGSICSGSPPIPSEVQETIKVVSEELVTKILLEYTKERDRIINGMKESAPRPFEDLLYSDYPHNNRSKITGLAMLYAVSEDAKKRATDKIKEIVKPELERETANMNSFMREVLQKAVEKAIERAIEEAVDKAVEQIKKKDENNK